VKGRRWAAAFGRLSQIRSLLRLGTGRFRQRCLYQIPFCNE
jgi:hypothetical protein